MKKIIITGAAGGIGLATLKHLSAKGYFVYAIDIKKIEEMENVVSFQCDLTKEEELKEVYNSIKDEKIDAIVHLGGTYYMDSFIEISEEKLKEVFDINFFSVYLVNKTFISILNKNAKIIITSSELAPLDPLPFNGIYSITKATLENYALSLRQELNLLDIKVIILRPGAINTSLIDESIKNVERIEKETVLYKDNAPLFKSIVQKNESKTIEAIKLAKLIEKIVAKKRNKLLYKINLNPKLILLSCLPKRLQLYIIKKLISKRK